jgi:Domain of unknown function (DUF4437)
MKVRILAVMVSFLMAVAVLAQTGDSKKAVIWPAADLKWTDVVGGPPGVKIVNLWGDYTTGPYGALMKFPAGFSAPLHTHTPDMRAVIVSGTFIHTPEGKPEVKLGPGSYLMQPGGSYRHMTACGAGSECVFFVEGDEKFDLLMVDAVKAQEKM